MGTNVLGAQVETQSSNDSEGGITASSHESDKLENSVDWIRRVTEEALAAMRRAGVPDWVEEQHRRKWRWAGHICRRTDERWTQQVLLWTPTGGQRCHGHPCSRWADDINEFVRTLDHESDTVVEPVSIEDWRVIAQDRGVWSQLEDDYVNYCYGRKH